MNKTIDAVVELWDAVVSTYREFKKELKLEEELQKDLKVYFQNLDFFELSLIEYENMKGKSYQLIDMNTNGQPIKVSTFSGFYDCVQELKNSNCVGFIGHRREFKQYARDPTLYKIDIGYPVKEKN